MHIATKSGRIIKLPTPAEDAQINAGIAADQESREWTDQDFALAKPASEFFDAKTYSALAGMRGRGRPVGTTKEVTKERVTLRLDADVLAAIRATGKGWQTRVNDAMRDWVRSHPMG